MTWKRCVAVLGVWLGLLGGASRAQARRSAEPLPAWRSMVLVDAGSGTVLLEKEAHLQAPPASMTKMMLMLLVAEGVAAHRLRWDDQVIASAKASQMGGSQVYLEAGESFSLAEMMQAITIHSANDAATAVAEAVAGSTDAFVELMNKRARELGMTDTIYRSVHGLPPEAGQSADLSSAADMAKVARELVKHAQILKWSGTREAPFRGGKMVLTNTNRLVRETNWVDGLKTGFYREAGFNVTATAERNGLRLIAVVMGAPQKGDCFAEAERLLQRGFADYRTQLAVKRGELVSSDVLVRNGSPRLVRVVAGEDLSVLSKRGEKRSFQLELSLSGELQAPLEAQTRVGDVVVKDGETVLGRVPALVNDAVRPASLWERIF